MPSLMSLQLQGMKGLRCAENREKGEVQDNLFHDLVDP
jgi:hypothetical protein